MRPAPRKRRPRYRYRRRPDHPRGKVLIVIRVKNIASLDNAHIHLAPTRPQSLHKYTYAENNPATYTDPSGKLVFVPVFLALWAVAEAALQIYDTYDLAVTLLDPCVAEWEKYATLGLYVAGAFLPGGGYAAGGKAVLKRGDDVVRGADKGYGCQATLCSLP